MSSTLQSVHPWLRRGRAAQLKKDKPDLSFGEVGKELGKMWKEVDEKAKEKYNAMAKKEKERADKEIAAYKAKKEGESAAVRARDQPTPWLTRCATFVCSPVTARQARAGPAPGLQPLHDHATCLPAVARRLLLCLPLAM